MIKMIIGHRGVGKTELIKRLQVYEPEADVIDLDTAIEQKIGRSIRDMFLEHGEAYFREHERQLFLEILQRQHKKTYVVLGAGFDLSSLPPDIEVLWVRRTTDPHGRIFLDRPRLHPDISPLDEFKKRSVSREEAYRRAATEIYQMPEGSFDQHVRASAVEKSILLGTTSSIRGALTILPFHFAKKLTWVRFLERFRKQNILFEIRNDLLGPDQIEKALRDLAGEKVLYSFRSSLDLEDLPECELYDWPLDQQTPEKFFKRIPLEKRILSFHGEISPENREEKLREIASFSDQVQYLKLSTIETSYEGLEALYRWQQQDPDCRNILPRSSNGRWLWMRRLLKAKQFLNFWREGDGSALDQPSLFDWLATPKSFDGFAAVLGSPVDHSYTPIEHHDYFARKEIPVFAIDIGRDEWSKAFSFLQSIGLGWAAVTSPHKENAANLVGSKHAINTLIFVSGKWQGTSTDEAGFLELTEGIGLLAPLQKQIAVWGGGGVLCMMRASLPHAQYFSVRTGTERSSQAPAEEMDPQVVVWAAPREPGAQMPPASWKPKMVVDLNYKEDSLGKEYAQNCGASYQSGLKMFFRQAQEQRMFWNSYERK